jgi:leader peptidase (prepilin peptidase)/N-methyltransferase
MLRILATIFAALLGLAFGSFLNVCLSRWPEGESVVKPGSHCRNCNRTLAWWENIPVLSWLALRGRCRTCRSAIHWRYPLVEASVGVVWGYLATRVDPYFLPANLGHSVAMAILCFVLVGLAALDAEHLWLPDAVTLPMIPLGVLWTAILFWRMSHFYVMRPHGNVLYAVTWYLAGILIAAALILVIRWVYWLFRRKEGIGLGDAKLMALLAAWLGLPGALLSFFFGVILGALVAVPLVMTHRTAQAKLPLGTFLCIGGIVSALWGQQIIAAYLSWAGF